jgi:hypothetical protein
MSLRHLFDAELRHQAGMGPLVSDGEGELIGSGDGVVAGRQLVGTLRWTLFERPGALVCAMNPVAVIATDDGAEVGIEARGYARRRSTDERTWRVAATLRFESDDERYRWLADTLGVWEGEFDADGARASYRAYIQTGGKETT